MPTQLTTAVQTVAAPRRQRPSDAGPSDVAIVGMSCMFPKAGDLEQFWGNIVNKIDAVGEIPANRWDWRLYFDGERNARDRIYSKWGGFLDEVPFDPTRYGMPPNSLPSVEPLQLLVLEAVRHALDDAGYGERPFDRQRTSVILGAGGGVADLGLSYGFRALLPYFITNAGGTAEDAARLIEQLDDMLPKWTEDSFAGLLMNVAAGRVANRFDLSGTNYTVDAACASSLAAVRLGVSELESGSSDMVIVGGADTMQSPFAYLCFSKTQALSPTGKCRTFDESADGIVISEGIAIAVLKRLDDAVRDGDRVYAVIKGVGSSSDGRDRGLTAPRPAGQIRALERAYAKAGFDPTTVGLIEAHGTGTVAGDQSEVESLTQAFARAGAATQGCALGSVKSMIGHTKCAAGVAGLLKAALALHYKVLPPTAGVTRPNPKANFEASPFYVNTETRPWLKRPDGEPRRAGVSAFGFGGTNFHAALEEHMPEGAAKENTPVAPSWPAELFVWRAGSVHEIGEAVDRIAAALDEGAAPAMRDLAAAVCREHGQGPGACCLAIVAGSLDDLRAKLTSARLALGPGETDLGDPKGVYLSANPAATLGKIAFLFPGQGSQSVNMLRDLANGCPGARRVFEEADQSLGDALGRPLSSYIFPRPTFTTEARAADEEALTQTEVAQPAMGAADLAMYRLLSELGVAADMACGHSYGEYAALCAAGVFDPAGLMRISEARGRLIAEAAKDNPGTMAAVGANESAVAGVVECVDGVSIANLNTPSQTVITGTEAGVDEALRRMAGQGIAGRRIKVSCAFHSTLVAEACEPFAKLLREIGFTPPQMAVYSNTTARPHSADPEAMRAQLVEHMVQPVRFADELMAMHDAGARVFVEVGPGRTLTGFVERTLKDRKFLAVSLDRPGGNGLTILLHALAKLSVAGVGMRFERLFAGRVEAAAGGLDLARLVELTKPAPLSPVTWMVNGARAVPIKKHSGLGAEKPNRAKPSLGHWKVDTADSKSNPQSPIPTRESAVSNSQSPIPNPQSATSPGPAAGQSNGVDPAMRAYQSLMAKFLDTQGKVMLAYLQQVGQGAAGEQAPQGSVSHPASSAPTRRPVAEAAGQFDGSLAPDAAELSDSAPADGIPRAAPVGPRSSDDIDANSAVPAAASDAGLTRENLIARLVAIVSDRTGYPPDMLDLDLDLEADLGIDSIKRIEIMGTLRNESVLPGESADGAVEELARQKTLRGIVDWIIEKAGSLPQNQPEPRASARAAQRNVGLEIVSGAPETPQASPAPPGATGVKGPAIEPVSADSVEARVTSESDQQVPRMLLEMQECPLPERVGPGPAGQAAPVARPPGSVPARSPLDGVVLITDDAGGIAASLARVLGDGGMSAVVVAGSGKDSGNGRHRRVDLTDPKVAAELIKRMRAERGRIAALVHLLPLANRVATRSDDPTTWSAALTAELRSLFNLVQNLESDLGDGRSGRVIVASRMDGAFAGGPQARSGDVWPGYGGVCGFTKTLAREWTDVACTAIDFDPAMSAGDIAGVLRAELLTPDGNTEVGYRRGKRVVLRPVRAPLDTASDAITLGKDSVVLVTGGARGITAEVTMELARRFQPRLLLVGRSSLPTEEEDALSETGGVTEAKELKAILRRRIERAGEKATPALVTSAYTRLLRDREMRANIATMRAVGATVEYHAVDVGDEEAFGGLIEELYARHGRIDGVIHGAGVTEDKLIRDKTFDSVERVLRPKVNGALTLASRLRGESLKFLFFFSSVSARFGNRGQCDYAAANEVLNKLAHWLNVRLPGRVASLNWGPWESAGGMVSPELATQFAKAGVQLISPPAGRRMFLDELLHGGKDDVEVVFGGQLTIPQAVSAPAQAAASGRAPAAARAAETGPEPRQKMPLLNDHARVTRNADGSVEVVRTLDPAYDLYLLDHQLDGRPVMPMAMALELLAEVASRAVPEMRLEAIRELRVLRGVTLESNSTKTLRVVAGPLCRSDGSVSVDLRGEAGPAAAGRAQVCYVASAEFGSDSISTSTARLVLTNPQPFPMSVAEAYERWLFHGPLFAGIAEVEAIGGNGIIAKLSPSSPRRCLAAANGSQWLIDPVVVDSGLQLLILWARSHFDMTPLPARLGCYHRLEGSAAGDVRCEVRIRSGLQIPAIHADLMLYDEAGRLFGWLEDMEVTCSKALNRLSRTRVSPSGVDR